MKLVIIVPAFNEAPVIRKVLVALKKEIASLGEVEIVVVDDGSVDATAKEAMTAGAKILSHPINRGLGGALGTGLTYAKLVNADIAVTFDADGQHAPGDIRRVIEPIRKGDADVVIGSRTLKGMQQIPFDRRIILWFGNVITKLLFSVSTSDSQSGFRAFSKPAIRQISLKTQEMEASSEFFSEINRLSLQLTEVPIHVIYTSYSRKKGQSNLNAFGILGRLLLKLAR